MRARLITRCGCTRDLHVRDPIVMLVRVPLFGRVKDGPTRELPETPQPMPHRDFEFVGYEEELGGRVAIYREAEQ